VNLYKSWEVKNADFIPLAFTEDDYNPRMTEEDIIKRNRDIDIIFLGERESSWRQGRLDSLVDAFPKMFTRGRGWPKGYLPESERIKAYQRSKIGINLHNSVGPVNLRTYMLPANGVMQICDNKHMLGYLFKLGEEVIGYNSINEATELIRYYLVHEEERKRIALNGWKRALRDYSEEAVWELLTDKILKIYREIKNDEKEKYFEKIIQIKGKNKKKNIKHYKGKLKPFFKKHINGFLNRYGYEIQKKKNNLIVSNKDYTTSILPYLENLEKGPVNFEVKKKRVSENGPFERPNIIALNQTVVSLFGNEKKILEIGSETGCFAWHAAMDKNRYIVASEMDKGARNWAIKNRAAENIEYVSKSLNEFSANSFNLIVAVEIIEHLKDYSDFLKEFVRIAPEAIITTPNKNRDEQSAEISPPKYYQHVREWTAGEFYWVLKTFYRDVKLYAMPNVYVPYSVPIDITSKMTPVIGVCKK
jgi:2-polyprenyl-3-methyl-5-hydroxy-6-metoxy-1,4-benzoquinol methylase